VGRPKGSYKAIDLDMVEKLAAIGCTMPEIAAIVGCSERTLRTRASEQVDNGREKMKVSLRRWQYEKAKDGNVPMLIWLGKQYLGQSDRHEQKVTEEIVTIERIAPKIGLTESA
jgi:predicted transcriptional regulator